MVSIYYLSGFNNYYNRTILLPQSTSLTDYTDYLLKIDEVENFNPNDNVMTELTVNYWGTDEDISDLLNIDYILISSDNRTIDSKWFALDRKRIRGQQWHFTLRRDLVSDNYEAVINAPCFIEKATLPADSPLLWNKENMTFNQIKQEETLLKDGSGCPWIVGYYAKNIEDDYLHGTVDANDLEAVYDEYIETSFANWKYNATKDPFTGIPTNILYTFNVNKVYTDYVPIIGVRYNGSIVFDVDCNYVGSLIAPNVDYSLSIDYNPSKAGEEVRELLLPQRDALKDVISAYLPEANTNQEIEEFLSYNGKIIKDSEGKYYSISITYVEDESIAVEVTAGAMYNIFADVVEESKIITGNPNSKSFKLSARRPKYKMVALEIPSKETIWDMRGTKTITNDAPYNIFAMPYGSTQLLDGGWGERVATSNSHSSMATANSIIRTMGSNLYDIQLLPYCPIGTPMNNGLITVYDADNYSQVKPAAEATALEDIVTYILHIPYSKFSKNIPFKIDAPDTAVEKKVSNECEMYRLCSPNYNGAFEFSPAKNNGVDYFNVDCEYKPFQPYIHINPNFKGMYGSDFNDARGLICNGDFSLPQIKDAWQEYQIQNKNYNEIFSRQIENINVNNYVQRQKETIEMAIGSLTAGLSGFGSGVMLANPSVGLATGFIGAGASALGGVADIALNEKLRMEALDMTKDQFTYSLGNIQALPYTLTKVSAHNNNNKLFPFLEKYSATDIEKQTFRDKLFYDGMTTMVIGKISDYQQATPSYIKGRLIRLLNSQTLDFHGLSELANEIYKGVII